VHLQHQLPEIAKSRVPAMLGNIEQCVVLYVLRPLYIKLGPSELWRNVISVKNSVLPRCARQPLFAEKLWQFLKHRSCLIYTIEVHNIIKRTIITLYWHKFLITKNWHTCCDYAFSLMKRCFNTVQFLISHVVMSICDYTFSLIKHCFNTVQFLICCYTVMNIFRI
jgi:hypothetical protein